MKLLLKNADGESVSVTVFDTDTFSDLRSRIAEEDNVDVDIGDFRIEGRPIQNDSNVVEYLQSRDAQTSKIDERAIAFSRSQTCRLCAGNFDSNSLLDVFTVMDKIAACLPIKIERDDALSKLVCLECTRKLDYTKSFIDSCISAEKKQMLMLESRHTEGDAKDCPICVIKDSNDVSFLSTSEFFEAFENHNRKCPGRGEAGPGVGAGAGPEAFCSVCCKNVRLTSLLRSECHGGNFCFLCASIVNDRLSEHLKAHHVEIVHVGEEYVSWRCGRCDLVSNDGSLLEEHVRSHAIGEKDAKAQGGRAQKQSHRCHLCSKTFRCKTRLEFHVRFHVRGSDAGQCSVCRKEFATELCLYKHMLYNHLDPKVFTCEHCGKSFRNKSSLTYHFRSHSSLEAMKPFVCEICNKRFARRNILRDHMSNRHGSEDEAQPRTCFQCHVCREVFPNTDSAISHMEIHHPEKVDDRAGYSFDMLTANKLFACEFCDKCFALPANVIEHRLQHGEPAKFQCKMCNEELSSFVELRAHQESHAADGIPDYKADFHVPLLFTCRFCEKCFKNHQAFVIHGRGHDGDVPFKCRFCSESFRSYRDSAEHRLTRHASERNSIFTTDCLKPFECQYCNKAFTAGSALAKHVRIHTGEKPYLCRVCNKSFAQSSGLYTHLKVHSNDRPYECDLCSRSFKIIGDYKQHVRRHSGVRSYVCDVCKKSFMTQRSFSQHKNIHTNLRPHTCDVCQQSFRRSHTLKIHKLRHARNRQ